MFSVSDEGPESIVRCSLFWTALLLLFATRIAQSAPRLIERKEVGGTVIEIFDEGTLTHRVVLGGRTVYFDRDDLFVSIAGIYEGGGRAYALISEASGGNACPSVYRAIDVTTRGLVSEAFGTCSDVPQVELVSGVLIVRLSEMNGQAIDIFSYSAGHLTKRIEPIAYRPSGPASAPFNDIAAATDGKYLSDAAQMRVAADAIRRVMGFTMFDESRRRVQGGVNTLFESRGDFSFATACAPHLCGREETGWAFDHFGHAWASWTTNGQTSFYGNPPATVRAALTR